MTDISLLSLAAHELGHCCHAAFRGADRVTCHREPGGWMLEDNVDLLSIRPIDLLPGVMFTGLAAGCAGEHALRLIDEGMPHWRIPFAVADLWRSGAGFWTPLGTGPGGDAENATELLPGLPGGVALVEAELAASLPVTVATLALLRVQGLLDLGQKLAAMPMGASLELPVKTAQKAMILARAHEARRGLQ